MNFLTVNLNDFTEERWHLSILSKPLACHIELINTTLSSCSIQIESRLKTYVWSSRVIYTLLNLT